MLYMFTFLVAIMDNVLASGQPFIGCLMSDAKVQRWQSEIKRMEKRFVAWKNKGEPLY